MELKPSEIIEVDSLGVLDGEDVKIVKTVGGLYIAVGKPRGKKQEEVLAAGSHPAIVRFNVEKAYTTFQPSLMKSEMMGETEEVVEFTDFLPQDMINKNYDLYALKKNEEFDFVLTKDKIQILSYASSFSDDSMIISKPDVVIPANLLPAVTATTKAAALIAIEEGKSSIVHEDKKYSPHQILKKG